MSISAVEMTIESIDFDVIKISPNTILLRAVKYFLKGPFRLLKY